MTALKNLAIALAAVGLTLLVMEVGLRTFGRYTPPPNPPRKIRPDLYRADPRLGYRLWPSTRTCNRHPASGTRVVPVVSNSDGFRSSRELGSPDPRPRVLVAGDSFVFGLGVAEWERLTEALEPGWRVDNIGMTGFGIDLAVRAVGLMAPKARPDVVVLAVYTDDFRRAHRYWSGPGFRPPRFALRHGELVTVPFPAPSRWKRLRLLYLVETLELRLDRNLYPLNEAILDRFLDEAAQHDFQPAVVFLPGKGDTAEDRERRSFLSGWAAAHGVPYHDMSDAFQQAGVAATYLARDPHWNPAGHALAARELRLLLREVGVVRRHPPEQVPPPPPIRPYGSWCTGEAGAPREPEPLSRPSPAP